MRSKITALLVCIHCLGLIGIAQTTARRQLVLQVSNGGFISFKSEASATDNKRVVDKQSLEASIYSNAQVDENRVIHRVLTDASKRVIFSYDLSVSADPATRKFALTVMPADDALRQSFLKQSPQRTDQPRFTFPRSTKPQTLDDGDAVSLELLVNEELGVKIVDLIRVTFDRSTLLERSPETVPRDFTLDAIALSVKRYELFIEGNLVGKGKSTIGCTGTLLWFYVPSRGRIIFSLVPREGYSFDKIGVIDGNRIEFDAGGEHFEWVSSEPILPNGGTWNLWVFQDPHYAPLFNTAKPIRTEPGVLDKLKNMVGVPDKPALTMTNTRQIRPSSSKDPVIVPERVMVGGADGVDNLLPKALPKTP